MPTYRVRCQEHGDMDLWASIHDGSPDFCPHCDFPVVQVLTSPHISSAATPNRTGAPRTNEIQATEARWDKDMAAYKRLRADGVQPKAIDGAAEFEAKADSNLEIRRGKLYPDKQRLKDAADQASSILGMEVEV